MSTLRVNNITDTSGGSSSLSVPGAAKAFVNFNGTGTVAIRAQLNVSSITDNGTGDYTVNFTTAMADANYAAVGTAGGTASATVIRTYEDGTARTASLLRVATFVSNTGAAADFAQISVAIFR